MQQPTCRPQPPGVPATLTPLPLHPCSGVMQVAANMGWVDLCLLRRSGAKPAASDNSVVAVMVKGAPLAPPPGWVLESVIVCRGRGKQI